MKLLQDRINQDRNKLSTALNELHRIIEHDETLQLYLTTKAKERGEDSEAAIAAMLREGGTGMEQQVEFCRTTFDQIKQTAMEEDVSQMVRTFLQNEDENFTLYTYVNQLNNEIDRLEGHVDRLNVQVKAMSKEEQKKLSTQNEEREILEANLDQKTKDLENMLSRKQSHKSELEQIRLCIKRVFNRTGCDDEPLLKLLAGGDIMDHNILEYMSMLEGKIIEMLLFYEYTKYKEQEALLEKEEKRQEAPLPPLLPESESIESLHLTSRQPRSIGGEEDKISKAVELAGCPLTTDELKVAAACRLGETPSPSIASSHSQMDVDDT